MTNCLWGQRNNLGERQKPMMQQQEVGWLEPHLNYLILLLQQITKHFVAWQTNLLFYICGGQKFKTNGLKSKASRPAFISGSCREKSILLLFPAPREQVLCCWKRLFALTRVFSWLNSVSLCPVLFVLQGQTCLLLQVFLDFLLLDSSFLWWKGHLFFGVSSIRSYRFSQKLST